MKERNRNGKTITFYSYKGGVGRSMAMINLACLLGNTNKKILLIDWDLEAPGLHLFCKTEKEKEGLVDFISDLVAYVNKPENNDEDKYLKFYEANVNNYIEKNVMSNTGSALKLDLIKAGRFGVGYSDKLAKLNWLEIYETSPSLFTTFAIFLESIYDYIFIDSRTGLADSCGITTLLMPQKLVLVFGINYQNINGVLDIANQALAYRLNSSDHRSLNIYPLPARIENTVTPDLSDWLNFYKNKFETLFKEIFILDKCDLSAYFDRSTIPYYPIHAHGENIPVLSEPSSSPSFISYHYKKFLDVIVQDIPAWEVLSLEQEMSNEKLVSERIIEALKLKERGDLIACVNLLDEISEISSANSLIYSYRGAVKADLGELNDALIDFNISINLNSDDATTYLNRGNVWERLGNNIAAVDDYSKAIDKNPNYAEAYRNRGKVLSFLGDDIGAIRDLEAAAEIQSSSTHEKISAKGNPIVMGLDIGTSKTIAIVGRKNEIGKLDILGFGRVESHGISHGTILNVEQCTRSIKAALDSCLLSNPNLDLKEVTVGISGQSIKISKTNGQRTRTDINLEIDRSDLDLLIRDQYITYIPALGEQIIEVIPQHFTVDNISQVLDPIGMSGTTIAANFNIITGDKNAIRNLTRCVDKAGLVVRDIVLQSLASAAAILNDEDLEAGVAIVDIGGGTTDIAVFFNGALIHTAIIPYGGNDITNDIRNGMGVLRSQAEALKVQFGSALAEEVNPKAYITIPSLRGLPAKELSARNVSNIIQARMQEILDHVMYQIKQIDLTKKLYGGIIFTGGGAQLKNLAQLSQFVTGLPSKVGLSNRHLAASYADVLENPIYSTSIGLLLRDTYVVERNRFNSGAFGNVMHISDEIGITSLKGSEVGGSTDKEKRDATMQRLFANLKGKFMNLFDESDSNNPDENINIKYSEE